MEHNGQKIKTNRAAGVLFAVSAALAAAFFALHLLLRGLYSQAMYGYRISPERLILSCAGFALAAAIALAGVRLLKTRRIMKLAGFIFAFGLIVSVLPIVFDLPASPVYRRYMYTWSISLYVPCYVLLAAFVAGIAGTYRAGWKWQSIPTTLALLALPCTALMLTHSVPLTAITFFVWFFFMLALARDKRMRVPWYVLGGVSVLFIGLFTYMMLAHANGMEHLTTLFTRGKNDPLDTGYVRTLADSVFKDARLFGPMAEKMFAGPHGELPVWLYLTYLEYVYAGLAVLAKLGWAAFAVFLLLQFVIPAALLFSSRRAPNSYARYFALYVGLYLLGKSALGVFNVLFSDLNAGLPFLDGTTSAWMDVFLLSAAYALLLFGEKELPQAERVYNTKESVDVHLLENLLFPFHSLQDPERERKSHPNFGDFRNYAVKTAQNADHTDFSAVYINADGHSAANGERIAEALRAAGKTCVCFTENPICTEREEESLNALRTAGVFVRVISGRSSGIDRWEDMPEIIALNQGVSVTVGLAPEDEAGARAFAERLLRFLG